MKLVVVSHTPHHRRADGMVVGWGPTVRELDQLASLFSELVHVAPLHPEAPNAAELPYASSRVRLLPVRPAGGTGVAAKLGALAAVPRWAAVMAREMRSAGAIHVRCPAGISLVGALLAALPGMPRRRWIKYAGNWSPPGPEPASYRLQRLWLAHGAHGAQVTVNGRWPGQPAFVHSFLNPCLTADELADGARAAEGKAMAPPVRLLFAGRLEEEKGALRAVGIWRRLRQGGVASELDLVGDGPARAAAEGAVAQEPGLRVHGWLSRGALARLYAQAHVFLLPATSSEGWPKVVSEAMAYGAVPVVSDVSSMPQILAELGCGRALPATDEGAFAAAIAALAGDAEAWRAESGRAVAGARRFSYDAYLRAVARLLDLPGPGTAATG